MHSYYKCCTMRKYLLCPSNACQYFQRPSHCTVLNHLTTLYWKYNNCLFTLDNSILYAKKRKYFCLNYVLIIWASYSFMKIIIYENTMTILWATPTIPVLWGISNMSPTRTFSYHTVLLTLSTSAFFPNYISLHTRFTNVSVTST